MKTLIVSLLAAITVPAFAQDFSATYAPRTDAELVSQAPASQGALQMAARNGNPLQVINPAAPPEYGSGPRFVAYQESDPFLHTRGKPRPIGFRLCAFSW